MRTSSPQPHDEKRLDFRPLLLCVGLSLAMANCASPGEPIERKPLVYTPVTDLAASQSGNDVILSFTMPDQTADGRQVTTPASIEIFRSIHPLGTGGQSGSVSAPALLVTIPSSMVSAYQNNGEIRYADTLTAGDFLADQPQSVASYLVRTRASSKRDSADSNRADLEIVPGPVPVADLQTRTTQSAIVLSWSAPLSTLTGTVPAITGYHVYRANAAQVPSAANSAPQDGGRAALSTEKAMSPLVEIGESSTTDYRDGDVQTDRSYVYSVRSTMATPGKTLESADSNLASVTLKDVFPPSPPTELIVTPVPAEAGTPAHMDLSWAINPETDLAGYNVYRSEQAGQSGTRINDQLLPTPAFRDSNAVPGHNYYYKVTAVDRAGNESAASSEIQSVLPANTGGQTSP